MGWRDFFRGMGSVMNIWPAPTYTPISRPWQQKAWCIDHDGTKHYHDLDLTPTFERTPHGEVRIHKMSGETQVYRFSGEEDGFLIYKEV
jgi:hypothetical protein